MQKTANLKKHIDFNLLGDDNEANHMDLDENDLSEEITDVSPPPLKYARVPVSRISMGRRHSFEVNAPTNGSSPMSSKNLSLPNFSSPSPTPTCRVSQLFPKESRKSFSRISATSRKSLAAVSRCETPNSDQKSSRTVNVNPFTSASMLASSGKKRELSPVKR